MNINEFLKLDKPEEYDFKLEGANALFGKIDDALERYLLYKLTTCKGSAYPQMDLQIREKEIIFGLTNVDCDTAPLTKEVYQKLWKEAIMQKTSSMINGEYGETMTSMQTMLNELVKQVEPPKRGKVSKRYCKIYILVIQILLQIWKHTQILELLQKSYIQSVISCLSLPALMLQERIMTIGT